MASGYSPWPDVLNTARAEPTAGLSVPDAALDSRRKRRRRGVPTQATFISFSDSEESPVEHLRLSSPRPAAARDASQTLEYRVTASLLSLSSGGPSNAPSLRARSSDDRKSSSSSYAPRTSSGSSKQSTPASSRNRRNRSLPNFPATAEAPTEEDDDYWESAQEWDSALESQDHAARDSSLPNPDPSSTQELTTTQDVTTTVRPDTTDTIELAQHERPDTMEDLALDPHEYPYVRHSAAASVLYGPKRHSDLLKQAASLFSMSPSMEVRSTTINILQNGQSMRDAASSSDDEQYVSARSSVESNFVPPNEYVVQLPAHFKPVGSKLPYEPTASPYTMSGTPHELRKQYRRSLREKDKDSHQVLHLSVPSSRSPPRASSSTPTTPLSDRFSDADANELETFIHPPRSPVVHIAPLARGQTDASTASSHASLDLYRFLPARLRCVPPNAFLFFAGFVFFPCFWIGAFYPRLEHRAEEPWRPWAKNSQGPAGGRGVVTEENLQRYSWRGQHEGALPNVRPVFIFLSKGFGLTTGQIEAPADALPGWKRLSNFLNVDPKIEHLSYWANQRGVYVWRQRCRVGLFWWRCCPQLRRTSQIMSIFSVALLVAIIVAAVLAAK